MATTLRRFGNANLIQAAMIQRYAARHAMPAEAAARVWITAHGRSFRSFWNRHNH